MKRLLLLLGAAALLVAAPATAQYIFLDTNHDAKCDLSDVLSSSITSVDVYFDPTHNADGSTVTCNDGSNVLDFFSYGVVLRSSGSGSVTYGTFTDNAGFNVSILPAGGSGGDFWVGNGSTTISLPPSSSPYKVGTLAVTVTGTPVLSWISQATVPPPADANALTVFGSNCLSPSFDATWYWGIDFQDACGTATLTPTQATTWGAIKKLYR